MATPDRTCKDCPPGSKRPTPHPGPRCATCHRAHRKAQKARTAERRNINTYGLAEGDYDRLYAFQGGRCAICQRATGKTRRLAVDHDHKTGEVRALFCAPCNRLVGHLRDSPEAFERAAAALRNPPARQLGITAVHVDNRQTAIDPPPAPGGLQPWPFTQPDLPAAQELNRERRQP